MTAVEQERSTQQVRLSTSYWADDAACRTKDVALFYGSERVPLLGKAALPGRRVCIVECSVRRDCLIAALLEREWMGIRAGYLGGERRHTLNRHNGDIAAALADHDAGDFYQPRSTT